LRWRQIARKNRAVLFFPTEERRGRIGSRAATQLPKLSDLGINKSGTTKGRTVSARSNRFIHPRVPMSGHSRRQTPYPLWANSE
jgi:hypothetical protein